jgi:hypothetical protein
VIVVDGQILRPIVDRSDHASKLFEKAARDGRCNSGRGRKLDPHRRSVGKWNGLIKYNLTVLNSSFERHVNTF